MTNVRRFDTEEISLATQRYMAVTDLGRVDFFVWLGFNSPMDSADMGMLSQIPIEAGIGTSCDKKLGMLLSDHWYALMKAHMARKRK